jgi:DnaJ family protein C protein 7
MAPAAVEVRSPVTSAQPTPSSSVPQNPSSDYPVTFGAIASSDFSEDQGSSSSSSLDAAAKCDRGSGFTTNVPRTGSRVRPRLVKIRRQLGSPHARSRSPANEVVSGSNPLGSDSARVGDGASTSNGVSESSDGVSNVNSACKGFSFSIGDAKSVKFESVGFVFGANRSAFDANLGSVVGGSGESVGNSGSGDGGTMKVGSGRESGKIENLGFVFGAKQSGFASNSDEEKRLSGGNVGKSVVGDEGNVEAESELEHGKFSDLGFMFGAAQSNMASNSNTEKREYGERKDKLGSEDAGKTKLETETEFGKHDNVGYVFGVSQSDLRSNLNLGKGGSSGNSEKPETVTEKCADQSELGSTSISRKRECSRSVSILDSENGGMLKAGNEAEFGKHVDMAHMGFVFGSSWFNLESKNLEKRESAKNFGKLDTEDGGKVKVESGAESGKVKATVVNFDSDGDRRSNNNCEKEVFVFGSGSKKKSSFNEYMAAKCPSEIELNCKIFGNCQSIETQIGDLGSDVEGKGKSVLGSTSNVASFSSTSPLFELPDEMRKMKIDDSENVDGTHKTENLDKNSCANHGAASMFQRSERASDSFNRSTATSASIGISSSKEFSFQAGLSKDFDMGQFPQGQINDDTQWNASAAPSSFSSIGIDCQPNGSVSEIPYIGGLENKDGNYFTSIPDGPGVSFTAFSQPKWDPSLFKGNLFPEVNKKAEFAVKGRSIKDKSLKKMRGKLKPASLSKQKLGQDHVLKEFSSQENPDSPGCYSPMDFSPYQETAAANPHTREASVTSEEFSYLDTDFAPSALHSTVLNDVKDEDLAAAEGLDINISGQKAREQNQEKFCYHDGRSFVCDCPLKGFFSGAETTCSSSNTQKFCSSGGAGVASTEVRHDFTSNMERQENNFGTQFHFASSVEDMKENFFTFSSSSSAQGSLPATKRQHRKKSRGKVGRHSSVITPSTNVNTQPSSVQLSPLTSTSSPFDTEDKSRAHEQFKQGHGTFSAAIQEICEKFRLRCFLHHE